VWQSLSQVCLFVSVLCFVWLVVVRLDGRGALGVGVWCVGCVLRLGVGVVG